MSASALLRAVESRLRAVLDDPDGKICSRRIDGRPPGFAGQVFYAVHGLGARDRGEATTADQCDAEYGVAVTVTARLGNVPDDRRGPRVTDPDQLADLAEALQEVGVVGGNYADVMDAANALIPGTAAYLTAAGGNPADATTNGFEEPLAWLSTSPVQEKPATWVKAAAGGDVYAVEVRFGKARRLRLRET